MKKITSVLLTLVLVLVLLVGCGGQSGSTDGSQATAKQDANASQVAESKAETGDLQVIKVGASIVPHAEILAQIKDDLRAQGYDLEIVEFTDYVQPNLALDAGDLDANYFQHKPYLDSFNEEHNLDLVSAGKIHYEPFGIYKGSKSSLDELEAGDKISVPNDTTNEARALALLEAEGVIKIREGAGLKATVLDIVENPHNIEVVELEAAQLGKSIKDVAFSVINGNFALQEGLKAEDAIAFESKDSVGADTFANIIAVRKEDVDSPATKALIKALQSDKVKQYIKDTYQGAVEPSF